MSHAVVIDYESLSIECQSICKVASSQLCKLNDMLSKIDSGSTLLLNEQTAVLKKQLVLERDNLKTLIDNLVDKASNLYKLGRQRVDSDSVIYRDRGSIKNEANALKNKVDQLMVKKIADYELLLSDLLSQKLKENYDVIKRRATGASVYDKDFMARLETIDDELFKQYIYLEYLDSENITKTFEELAEYANIRRENNGVRKKKLILSQIESDLSKAQIDNDTKEKILSNTDNIEMVQALANAEIIGENIRKETLKIIIKNIENKGFIVDKKNIKLNKEKNEVIFVAQKVGGEKAEFKIYLDGKFYYKFDGYEGQACKNDINPFMKDLEEIYGIEIKKTQEIWSNPDKISTMKYQAIKTNNNKN